VAKEKDTQTNKKSKTKLSKPKLKKLSAETLRHIQGACTCGDRNWCCLQ